MQRLTISVHACTETLALIIAVAHADGRLEDREKDGVRGAAKVFNLPKDLRDRLDALLEKPAPVADLKLDKLSARERGFAYVASAWMARADEKVDPKEEELLEKIGTALGLAKERRTELDAVAAGLERPTGSAPSWSEELTKLLKAIPPAIEHPDSDDDFEVAFE